jgi:hypothetical protein
VQRGAPADEAFDRPVDETEEPQLLARGRIDGQAIQIVGIALGAADGVSVTVKPDRALAQKVVGRQPAAREDERRPPREPEQHGSGDESANHPDKAAGDEVHRIRERRTGHAAIEVACDREVGHQRRVLEMGHAVRREARRRQPIVEKRRHAIAEGVADRGLHRRQHLEEDEDDASDGKRRRERVPALHRGDEHAHRDREQRRQRPVQHHHGPPRRRQPPVGMGQRGKQHPLLALAEPFEPVGRGRCRHRRRFSPENEGERL